MNKFLSLAVVAALALPAITTTTPANAASGPSVKAQILAMKKKPGVHGINKLVNRCKYKKINVGAERMNLYANGHRRIRYLGTSVVRQRCAQFVRFSTCQGNLRKKVTIRYIKGANRYTIIQPNGSCPRLVPNRRLKLKTN